MYLHENYEIKRYFLYFSFIEIGQQLQKYHLCTSSNKLVTIGWSVYKFSLEIFSMSDSDFGHLLDSTIGPFSDM